MAAAVHFSALRDTIARDIGEAIAAGHCDTTEALMLLEDVLQIVEDGTDATFTATQLTYFADRVKRMAQTRRI